MGSSPRMRVVRTCFSITRASTAAASRRCLRVRRSSTRPSRVRRACRRRTSSLPSSAGRGQVGQVAKPAKMISLLLEISACRLLAPGLLAWGCGPGRPPGRVRELQAPFRPAQAPLDVPARTPLTLVTQGVSGAPERRLDCRGMVDVVRVAQVKPRLRGVFHEWAFYLAIPLGISIGLLADTNLGKVAAAVYAGGVVCMFGASALYHRVTWSPSWRRWLRRADHAGIYALIA